MKSITKEQEYFLYRFTRGTWMLNRETGLVDVIGTFNCSRMGLSDFMGIEFGNISGSFSCSNNKLVSLEGAPKKVRYSFYSYNNQLVSLEGAPQEIGGDFYCSDNQLVSLEGGPQEVGGAFYCSNNNLVSLEGAPIEVMGDFYCYNNKLVSLEGSPQKVGGTFSCSDNQLVSLEGAPQRVGAILNCDPITLRGCPINLLGKISFYEEEESIILKNYVRETIDGLEATVYFKKMI